MDSGSWWWTGRPGVLRFMWSQKVGHDWVTELNWTESGEHLALCFSSTTWETFKTPTGHKHMCCWVSLPSAHAPTPSDLSTMALPQEAHLLPITQLHSPGRLILVPMKTVNYRFIHFIYLVCLPSIAVSIRRRETLRILLITFLTVQPRPWGLDVSSELVIYVHLAA